MVPAAPFLFFPYREVWRRRKTKDKDWRERERYGCTEWSLSGCASSLASSCSRALPLSSVTGVRPRSSFWTLNRFACGNFPGVIFAALLAPSLTSLTSVYPPPSPILPFFVRFYPHPPLRRGRLTINLTHHRPSNLSKSSPVANEQSRMEQ